MLKFSVLGPPGLHFGGAWGSLGRLLGSPGRVLATSWACLGRSRAPLGCSWAPLGRILALMDASGPRFYQFLGGVGQGFGLLWG